MSDELLHSRIRNILEREEGYAEKKMFGSVGFMLHGHMCVGTWKGALVVRLSKDEHDQTLREPHTRPFDVTGRMMRGWALVEPQGIETTDGLTRWVMRAATFVKTLPPKP